MISKEVCIDALREVIDPEIGMNIIDLGLVYRLEPKEESIEVDFTLTSPGCPLADTIMQNIVDALRVVSNGKYEVVPQLVWNPPWSIEFMSEEARVELGYPI